MTLKEKVMELFGVSPDKSESVLGGNNVVLWLVFMVIYNKGF